MKVLKDLTEFHGFKKRYKQDYVKGRLPFFIDFKVLDFDLRLKFDRDVDLFYPNEVCGGFENQLKQTLSYSKHYQKYFTMFANGTKIGIVPMLNGLPLVATGNFQDGQGNPLLIKGGVYTFTNKYHSELLKQRDHYRETRRIEDKIVSLPKEGILIRPERFVSKELEKLLSQQ